MKKNKRWISIAGLFFITGVLLMVLGFAGAGFSFDNLSTQNIVETTLTPEGAFENISVVVINSDVTFMPSDDAAVKIVCRETEKLRHYAEISENTLKIDAVDTRQWFDHIGINGINFANTSVTVYLPEKEYRHVFIKTITGDTDVFSEFSFETIRAEATTGSINARNIEVAGEMNISVTTGKISLSSVSAGSLYAKTSTGKVKLADVNVLGDMTVKTTTGDILFERTDAQNAYLKATTGDVRGAFLSEKQFFAETNTGSVRIPETSGGGTCRAETTTGDIEIAIEG